MSGQTRIMQRSGNGRSVIFTGIPLLYVDKSLLPLVRLLPGESKPWISSQSSTRSELSVIRSACPSDEHEAGPFPFHRSAVRRLGFSEASEHGIGTRLGGVLEEERVARMPNIELAALDEAHAVEVSVANTHYSKCLAPTLRTNDPARLSALDQRQVVISDELDDEAFEWTPSVDLAILSVGIDVVAGSDAVSIETDQHIPTLLHEGIPDGRVGG